MRYSVIQTILKSARLILWPAIFLNTFLIATLLSPAVVSALCLSLALCFTSAFGFLINDLFDRGVDKINNAGRLENASADTIRAVQWASIAAAIVSLSCAALVSASAFFSVVGITAGLIAYTYVLRRRLFLANASAAILASSPLWLPFIAFGAIPHSFQLAVLTVSLLILFGREIASDAKDIRGDAATGRNTIATVFGATAAFKMAVTLDLIGCALLVGSVVSGAVNVSPFSSSLPLFAALIAVIVVAAVLPLWPVRATLPDLRASYRFIILSRAAMLLLPILLYLGS